nr:hypothetical protein [Streptomyces achromogenes]
MKREDGPHETGDAGSAAPQFAQKTLALQGDHGLFVDGAARVDNIGGLLGEERSRCLPRKGTRMVPPAS